MTRTRQQVGRLGEEAAVRHLERLGWRIIARNHRTAAGEIDVIAHDGSTLVFVEVRARSSLAFGMASEALTAAKARRLAQCALAYLAEHGLSDGAPGHDWRIDYVAVTISHGRVARLEHFKHALQ